jgi:hypothetical protein
MTLQETDMPRKKKATHPGYLKPELTPGKFYFWSSMVFEVDSNHIAHPRSDLGPDFKGKFKRKYR